MTKSKLFSELSFIPSNELREEINKVIAKNRSIPIDQAKYKKFIRPNEVLIIKQSFGVEM